MNESFEKLSTRVLNRTLSCLAHRNEKIRRTNTTTWHTPSQQMKNGIRGFTEKATNENLNALVVCLRPRGEGNFAQNQTDWKGNVEFSFLRRSVPKFSEYPEESDRQSFQKNQKNCLKLFFRNFFDG
ncbi:MAG: hypothetical protein DWH80_14440 [Planctomycetota bacterium]|nr:MAG: hypothetical protein DWH80_14440 [Planctomycetota bacterium]